MNSEEKEISRQLTDNQKKLLIEASIDSKGTVFKLDTVGGVRILTNGQDFIEPQNPRSRAEWEDAITRLCNLGLLEEQSYKGEVFVITHLGFKVADFLKPGKSE